MKKGSRGEDEVDRRAGKMKLKLKSEEDDWGDGGTKDKSVKVQGRMQRRVKRKH